MVSLRILLLSFLFLATPAHAQLEQARPGNAPDTHKNDLIELPDNQEIKSSQRSVIIVAKTEGAVVEWIVLNANPQSPVGSLDLAKSKTLIVFPNDQDDVIVVMAYTQVNGTLSKPVRHLIAVVKNKPGPGPNPGPGPGPAPTPAPAKAQIKHVSFIFDQATQTPAAASVITDQALRKHISDIGAKAHSVTVNSKSVVEGGLANGVRIAGGTPCIVLQDAAGNIVGAQLITTSDAAKQFIDQIQGK